MKADLRGTLMRYFLFLSCSITFLSTGIIETPCPCRLIFFTGTLLGSWAGRGRTAFGAIPMTPITGRTDYDLRLTTATMIKASSAIHRQKGRWGLDLVLRCVTLNEVVLLHGFGVWRHCWPSNLSGVIPVLNDTSLYTAYRYSLLVYWCFASVKNQQSWFLRHAFWGWGKTGNVNIRQIAADWEWRLQARLIEAFFRSFEANSRSI